MSGREGGRERRGKEMGEREGERSWGGGGGGRRHFIVHLTGRVRSSDLTHSMDNQGTALSLNLFPHHYLQVDGDDR